MLLRDEDKNIITGMLGAVAIHLIVLIIVLFARLEKVHHKPQMPVEIAFDKEIEKSIEKMLMEQELLKMYREQGLSEEEIVNAISNAVAEEPPDAYEMKKDMEEEHIKERQTETLPDESGIEVTRENEESKPEEKETVIPSGKVKGNVTLEYELGGRSMLKGNIPGFLCENAGTVVVSIVVNRAGHVLPTPKIKSASSEEHCLISNSLIAAEESIFESAPNAEEKQEGTITYKFSAQ